VGTIRKEKAKIKLRLPDPGGRPFDLVAFGENSLDVLAAVAEWPCVDTKASLLRCAVRSGGQAATVAVACARLGWRTRYVGCLGDDVQADLVRSGLISEGVDPVTVNRPGTPTRTAVILVDAPSGRRTVLESRDVRLRVEPGDFGLEVFRSGRTLLVDATDVPAATAAARAARLARVPTFIDVDRVAEGVDELLAEIDVIVVSADFPKLFTGAASAGEGLARIEARFRPAIVVATLGPDGALARCRGREIHSPALDVAALDTTGAGDAFRAGLIAGWLRKGNGADLREILLYAHIVAGLNCRGIGAQSALPTAELMSRFPV